MSSITKIAIDGPSGAGKSTIAKSVALAMKIEYVDTGAMYRAVAYKLIQEGIDLSDEEQIRSMLDKTDIDFSAGNIILDGQIINDKIRTPEITKMASTCSAILAVREKLVQLQRKMGETKSIIMDGRDIGANVLPDAKYKFFMTATAEERAMRRYVELTQKGETVTYGQVLADIIARDHNDSTRALNPLRKSADAIEIDTTNMSIVDVTEYILREVRADGNC